MAFEGYTQETLDFLWGIRFNNERSWFLAHKQDYEAHLLAPTRALGEQVYEALHAAVLWHNVLAHTGIVCHFATTEIHELADCINATTDDAYDDDSIINIG